MKTYRIYYRHLNTFFEVTEEQYRDYYRFIWQHLQARKRDRECTLPKDKLLYCDADCIGCKYRCLPRTISLDSFSDEERTDIFFRDAIASDSASPEDRLISEFEAEERAEAERQIAELLSRLPEQYRKAADLIKSGATLQASADALGITVNQFRYLKSKLIDMIKAMLK